MPYQLAHACPSSRLNTTPLMRSSAPACRSDRGAFSLESAHIQDATFFCICPKLHRPIPENVLQFVRWDSGQQHKSLTARLDTERP
jgi:hypothetical protein